MNNCLNKSICKLSLLLVIPAFSAVVTAGQQPPRLLEARAPVTFARPRRVSVLRNAGSYPMSFEQASGVEQAAFELINQQRLSNGLSALMWDSELYRLARQHSEDMGGRGFFDHETPEGLMPRDRARAAGLRGFRVIAENIAYNKGYENPGAYAVERWMKSPGHRANILYSSFQYSAIGSYVASDGSVYLTQVFISR